MVHVQVSACLGVQILGLVQPPERADHPPTSNKHARNQPPSQRHPHPSRSGYTKLDNLRKPHHSREPKQGQGVISVSPTSGWAALVTN